MEPNIFRIKNPQVDLFVRSGLSRPFSGVSKPSPSGTCCCEISQTASLSRPLLLSCCFMFLLWPHMYCWSRWCSTGRDCDIVVRPFGTAECRLTTVHGSCRKLFPTWPRRDGRLLLDIMNFLLHWEKKLSKEEKEWGEDKEEQSWRGKRAEAGF